MGFANLAQAIPSLALLGFLVPYMGIGAVTAVAMVVLYSLLPILKNTCTGLRNISADTLEAAKGIGMTDMQVLFKVRLPLALPVIMAGIRISSVTAVGLMTIAAYIGAGGLGRIVGESGARHGLEMAVEVHHAAAHRHDMVRGLGHAARQDRALPENLIGQFLPLVDLNVVLLVEFGIEQVPVLMVADALVIPRRVERVA